MKPASDSTVLVIDGGIFLSFAERLSRDFKRVIYCNSISQPFPKVHEACIGHGYENIETTADFWSLKDQVDVWAFPDCSHANLQNELVSQGKAVWGGRNGIDFELKRERFKEQLKSVGLEVGPFRVLEGLSALRLWLQDETDKFIKISKFRGNFETFHWMDAQVSSYRLDEWAIEFGGVKELIRFIVEDKIETEVEWGLDTYFAGGRFPSHVCHGIESKDKSYIGAFCKWDYLPEQIMQIAEAITPMLQAIGYANAMSMEVRIDSDGTPFLTDFTARTATPAGESQMEQYANFSEIVNAGAHGECLDPEVEEGREFSVQCILDHGEAPDSWRCIRIPEFVRSQVKLYSACKIGDVFWLPPLAHSCDSIGSVIGFGSTIAKAIEDVKDTFEAISDQPVSIDIESVAAALRSIEEAESMDVNISDKPVPEPESVLQ